MPFTHIGADTAAALTRAVGPISVYAPLDDRSGADSGGLVEAGLVQLRVPGGLDRTRLSQAHRQFRQWAEHHEPGVDDLAALYYSAGKNIPLREETAPTHLRDEIRNLLRGRRPDAPDHLLQAALFLTMAQEFDAHQESLAREFSSVSRIERDMYARITGDAEGWEPELPQPRWRLGQILEDPGTHMTRERLAAWAELALPDAAGMWAWLTTSRAVIEQLVESLAASPVRFGWPPRPDAAGSAAGAPGELARELAFSPDPAEIAARYRGADAGPVVCYLFENVSPADALARLRGRAGEDADRSPAAGGGPRHMVVLFLDPGKAADVAPGPA